MTDEDILDVLKGRKAVVPANRKQPTENSRRGSSSSRKSVERVTTDDLTKSFLQVKSVLNYEEILRTLKLDATF